MSMLLVRGLMLSMLAAVPAFNAYAGGTEGYKAGIKPSMKDLELLTCSEGGVSFQKRYFDHNFSAVTEEISRDEFNVDTYLVRSSADYGREGYILFCVAENQGKSVWYFFQEPGPQGKVSGGRVENGALVSRYQGCELRKGMHLVSMLNIIGLDLEDSFGQYKIQNCKKTFFGFEKCPSWNDFAGSCSGPAPDIKRYLQH